MKKFLLSAAVAIVAIIVLIYSANPFYFAGRSATYTALEPSLNSEAERGIAYFAYGDWGSLTSDALRVLD